MTHLKPLFETSASSSTPIGFLVAWDVNYWFGVSPTFSSFANEVLYFIFGDDPERPDRIWDWEHLKELILDGEYLGEQDEPLFWWGLPPAGSRHFFDNLRTHNPFVITDRLAKVFVNPRSVMAQGNTSRDRSHDTGYLATSIENKPEMLGWFMEDADKNKYRQDILEVVLKHLRKNKDPRVSAAVKFAELKRALMI